MSAPEKENAAHSRGKGGSNDADSLVIGSEDARLEPPDAKPRAVVFIDYQNMYRPGRLRLGRGGRALRQLPPVTEQRSHRNAVTIMTSDLDDIGSPVDLTRRANIAPELIG